MRSIPWRSSGTWLACDTHMHYRVVGLDRLAAESARRCGFIVITSHANRTGFFSAQPDLIAKARRDNPDLVIVNGVEWNTPIGKHAAVLAPGNHDGMEILKELVGRFDAQVGGAQGKDAFLEGLAFLGGFGEGDLRPTVILNHPLASPPFTADDLRDGLDVSRALIGFSGGGGHPAWSGMAGNAPGGEWISEAGGVYDTLLSEGRRPVVVADGDFHIHAADGGSDFWPGEFTRCSVYCPERTERGVFEGLRAGCIKFVLGPVIDSLDFTMTSGASEAMIGETLDAAGTVEARLDIAGLRSVDRVELIGNPNGPAEVVASISGDDLDISGDSASWRVDLPAPSRDCFFRIRGCGRAVKPIVEKTGVMCFYTNPIFVEPTNEGA